MILYNIYDMGDNRWEIRHAQSYLGTVKAKPHGRTEFLSSEIMLEDGKLIVTYHNAVDPTRIRVAQITRVGRKFFSTRPSSVRYNISYPENPDESYSFVTNKFLAKVKNAKGATLTTFKNKWYRSLLPYSLSDHHISIIRTSDDTTTDEKSVSFVDENDYSVLGMSKEEKFAIIDSERSSLKAELASRDSESVVEPEEGAEISPISREEILKRISDLSEERKTISNFVKVEHPEPIGNYDCELEFALSFIWDRGLL